MPGGGVGRGGSHTHEQQGTRFDAAEARKRALILHARQQITQFGFHNASLNEVIRLAGGSKATVTKYFGNRDGLFAAALAQSVHDGMAELDLELPLNAGSLLAGVRILTRVLLSFHLSPQAIATYRGIIASSGSGNSRASLFYHSGHLVVVPEVARYLERWRGRGIGPAVDLAAEGGRLTHLIRSDLYERALLGLQPLPVPQAELERFADAAAHLFVSSIAQRDN
ncbi:TetR/AcrR family transcriptional regulator [Novosphingobium sp. BL-52-GroH]|uniref:TetR/AcrR family transcriptional regulator n=1 Tax=Novosphingobium sp. BL-52-GroH TaxID=3349877 RepID=UPI00384FC36D